MTAGVAPMPDGIVVVDKAAGPTSHDVTQRIRRTLRGAYGSPNGRRHGPRVGHTGTLDPSATGVLVVCIGRATRLVSYLQAGRKTYEARIELGRTTTTLDADGQVTADRDAGHVDERQVCDALAQFVGTIQQVPPMVSAVKVDGERLHVRARRGEQVDRSARTVVVYDLVLDDFTPGRRPTVDLLVSCSPGTYIRTLADDLGRVLEVGAHLQGLRRLASGGARVEQAHALEIVERAIADGRLDDVLVSPAAALAAADYPTIVLDAAAVEDVAHGRSLPPTGHDGPVAAVDDGGRLIAVVADSDGKARPQVVCAPAGPRT